MPATLAVLPNGGPGPGGDACCEACRQGLVRVAPTAQAAEQAVIPHTTPVASAPQEAQARVRPPYPNPFEVSPHYAALMRVALALALGPGLGLGLLLVLVAGLGLPVSLAWPALAQGHGQVQTLGFTLLFILAVGMQLFPRFLGRPLTHPQRVVQGGLLAASAVLVRLVAQPLAPDEPVRLPALLLAAVLLPAGVLRAGLAFHGRPTRPANALTVLADDPGGRAWAHFVALGGLALGGALLLHTWALLLLAAGAPMVPAGVDEALIHLELAGFATCVAFGVASRVFGRFLLLRVSPSFERRLPWLAVAYGLGLAAVAGGWLADQPWLRAAGAGLEVATLAAWLWLVGLYDPPARASGTPHVTTPTRRWVRLAYAFLALGLGLAAYLYGREALVGIVPTTTALSAARHALAQGFLLVLMAGMAARLLPIYSADVLKRPWGIELAVDLLLVGALVRVVAELAGGYSGVAGPLVALGGAVGVAGFSLFAAGLWSSLGRLPGIGPRA